jgi:hypothetical protein
MVSQKELQGYGNKLSKQVETNPTASLARGYTKSRAEYGERLPV